MIKFILYKRVTPFSSKKKFKFQFIEIDTSIIATKHFIDVINTYLQYQYNDDEIFGIIGEIPFENIKPVSFHEFISPVDIIDVMIDESGLVFAQGINDKYLNINLDLLYLLIWEWSNSKWLTGEFYKCAYDYILNYFPIEV